MSRTQPGEGDKHKEYLGQRASICKGSENSTSFTRSLRQEWRWAVKASGGAGTYVSTGLVTEGVGPGSLINYFLPSL